MLSSAKATSPSKLNPQTPAISAINLEWLASIKTPYSIEISELGSLFNKIRKLNASSFYDPLYLEPILYKLTSANIGLKKIFTQIKN
jgi:hypothetical protein